MQYNVQCTISVIYYTCTCIVQWLRSGSVVVVIINYVLEWDQVSSVLECNTCTCNDLISVVL